MIRTLSDMFSEKIEVINNTSFATTGPAFKVKSRSTGTLAKSPFRVGGI